MKTALASLLFLWAGTAQAGILDIFRKKEEPPDTLGPTILGLDAGLFLLITLTLLLVGTLLFYRPRIVFGFLAEMVGEILAWIVFGAVAVCLVAGYVYTVGIAGLLAAVVVAIIAVVVTFFGI